MIRRLLLSALGLASLVPGQDAKKLTHDELKEMLKEDVFLLDVREPKELEEIGTLKGYTNIPMGQLEARMKELPKNKRILVAWNSGGRAARAADMLTKAGFKVAGTCGLKGFKDEKNPLIYPKAPPEKK